MTALLGDLRHLVPRPWSEILIVIASFLCGAVVGIERERLVKPAGLRTLILICMGSTIYTAISLSPAMGRLDPSRVAAQIVTGVGFLGAGTILRDRGAVTGLTTAATIWASAAVGIVVGTGYAVAGMALSAGIVFTLTGVTWLERLVVGRCHLERTTIVFDPQQGRTLARLHSVLDEARGPVTRSAEVARADGLSELAIHHCTAHRDHRSVRGAVADVPGVTGLT